MNRPMSTTNVVINTGIKHNNVNSRTVQSRPLLRHACLVRIVAIGVSLPIRKATTVATAAVTTTSVHDGVVIVVIVMIETATVIETVIGIANEARDGEMITTIDGGTVIVTEITISRTAEHHRHRGVTGTIGTTETIAATNITTLAIVATIETAIMLIIGLITIATIAVGQVTTQSLHQSQVLGLESRIGLCNLYPNHHQL